ncbi:g7692 [Coccomyxa viridis]|uniref:G7692 protein n=1 Tax=Coccomyxa viridis TaxID=1274662 RepID=A0ABP1G0Y4_9CHLO
MSIHCSMLRHARSTSPVLSERDAWVRMPAMKGTCGACSSSLPCPKARATSLAHRHRAARALLVSPMRIRPTKHRASAKPCARQSYQHVDAPILEALPQDCHPFSSDETEPITATLHMLAVHSDEVPAYQDSRSVGDPVKER